MEEGRVDAAPVTVVENRGGEAKSSTGEEDKEVARAAVGGAVAAPEKQALDAPGDGVPASLLASDQSYEAWFKRFGLDLGDPKMLDEDADHDGFSNRDEFLADTDPREAQSRPGIHKSLRLKEYREERVPLLLEEVHGETARIKLLEDAEGKTQSVQSGQVVLGMKVEKVVYELDSDKNGQPVDRSRVELWDEGKKGRVVLVKEMPAKSAESCAVLSSADGVEMTVRQGETFEWPAQSGTQYKVVDLRAQQAVVREVSVGRMWTIPVQ